MGPTSTKSRPWSLASFNIASATSTVVELTVVVVPLTVKFPVTVKLSATVTSEVECPIVTAIPDVSVACLSGPSHAEELIKKIPTVVSVASEDIDFAKSIPTIEFLEYGKQSNTKSPVPHPISRTLSF